MSKMRGIVIHHTAPAFGDIYMNPLKQAKQFSIPDLLTDIFIGQKLPMHIDAMQEHIRMKKKMSQHKHKLFESAHVCNLHRVHAGRDETEGMHP